MDDIFLKDGFQKRRESIINSPSFDTFTESISKLIDFFWCLEDLIGLRNTTVFFSDGKIHLLGAQPINSVIFTLNSIKFCCEYGNISDANVLIRKYRDDLFFYLYLLEANNKHEQFNFPNSKHSNNIKKWFNNQLSNLNFKRDIVPYLKSNAVISEVIDKYRLEDNWRDVFKNLNDYVHNNGVSYCFMNFCDYKYDDVKHILEDIINKINNIALFFVLFFILINPHYIMSSDYIDYCEFDMEPPDGSEYWVAPFIQEFVDENISKYNPKLKQFLKDNICMNIK